jgi:hypothetical protein
MKNLIKIFTILSILLLLSDITYSQVTPVNIQYIDLSYHPPVQMLQKEKKKIDWVYMSTNISLVTFAALDLYSTYKLLEYDDPYIQEANPFIRNLTYPQMVAVTVFTVAGHIVLHTLITYKWNKTVAYIANIVVNGLYMYATYNNLSICARYNIKF